MVSKKTTFDGIHSHIRACDSRSTSDNVASKARCEALWALARGAYEAVREHARKPQSRWAAQQFINALLQLAPGGERPRQRRLVGELEIAAHR